MARLVLSSGEAVLYQCVIGNDRITVGREKDNAIVVDDPAVSRAQAVIVSIGNDHILEDLESANGTWVNGKRVARRILQHGDVIALGRFHLRYVNTRTSSGVDLERTMLIEGLVRDAQPGNGVDIAIPPAPSAKTRLPRARAMMLRGSRSGSVVDLDRVVTLFGKRGKALAVVTRRPFGYFVTRVEGRRRPRVNGRPIGDEPRPLDSGDVIEVADEELQFLLD